MAVDGDHVRVVSGNEVVNVGKDLVIHVRGRQRIQIDGKVDASTAQAGSPANLPDARKLAMPPPASVTGEYGALGEETFETARLLWLVEDLPDTLYATGARLRDLVDDLAAEVRGVHRDAMALVNRGGGRAGRATEVIPDAAAVLARVEQAKSSIAAANQATAASSVPPGVSTAYAAVLTSLADQLYVAEAAVAAARAVSLGEPTAPSPGEGRGGGGADPQPAWEASSWEGGGSVLQITGGSAIIAPDGLTISSGDSSIEILPGKITISSPLVVVKGADLTQVIGSPIKLN
jgi:hypothetical protein